jgi:hypothetical protein
MPQFGKRVTGQQAYDKAVREEKGGAAVFGVRVRGAIPADGPTNIAKRNTEHGPRVVSDVQFQDHRGDATDAVAVEDLKDILAENPTFFDSLYEAELAREDGAREEALEVFMEVERGIKGQGREDVMAQINTLLGRFRATAAGAADEAILRREQIKRQQERQAENALLVDAPRIKAMKEREENLAAVEKAEKSRDKDGEKSVVTEDVNQQLNQLAEEMGIDRSGGSYTPKESAKPEGHTRPETQQPGERPLTPKKTSGKKRH